MDAFGSAVDSVCKLLLKLALKFLPILHFFQQHVEYNLKVNIALDDHAAISILALHKWSRKVDFFFGLFIAFICMFARV
jgi:hypothetical protein